MADAAVAERPRAGSGTVRPRQLSQRQALDLRFESLWRERSTFIDRWRQLADFILPTRQRFDLDDTNRGNRSNGKIIDSTATQSLRIAKSGLLAGMASPSRPWFNMTVSTPGLDESEDVREWLEGFRDAILRVLERSNFYTSLGELFEQELVFGTGTMAIFDDPKKVVRCHTFPIGSYAIAQDPDGSVVTWMRELTMSVHQVVEKFGWDTLSESTKNLYNAGNFDHAIEVRHAILRNSDYKPAGFRARDKRWREVFWEKAEGAWRTGDGRGESPTWQGNPNGGVEAGILFEGGFNEFPLIAARWSKNDDDTYGTSCPGIDALGDIKQLQAMEKVGLKGLNKMVDPPLVGGPSIRNKPVSLMAAAVTVQAEGQTGTGGGIRPIHETRIPLGDLEAKEEQLRQRIRRTFMEDIFLMLMGDARATPPTAEEVRARQREKMTILGPILERHSDDLFDPAIERIGNMLIRRSKPLWDQGLPADLPPPPAALIGEDWRPVYVSEVARAQKQNGLAGLEQHTAFVRSVAEFAPAALDKFNADAAVELSADMAGVPVSLTRDDDETADIREQRAQAQREQAAAEQAAQVSQAAKNLSDTDMQGQNALRLMAGGAA